jgi:hypothetical protein
VDAWLSAAAVIFAAKPCRSTFISERALPS